MLTAASRVAHPSAPDLLQIGRLLPGPDRDQPLALPDLEARALVFALGDEAMRLEQRRAIIGGLKLRAVQELVRAAEELTSIMAHRESPACSAFRPEP